MAASVWGVAILVHSTEMPTQPYGTGAAQWHLAYHGAGDPRSRANHYDVLTPNQLEPGSARIQAQTETTGDNTQTPDNSQEGVTSFRRREGKLPQRTLRILTANVGGAKEAVVYLCARCYDVLMIQAHLKEYREPYLTWEESHGF